MYNNSRNNTLVKERTEKASVAESIVRGGYEELFAFNKKSNASATKTKMEYQTPTMEFIASVAPAKVDARREVLNEDVMPSSTTMQFEKENTEVFEDLRAKNKAGKKVEKNYKINTRAKLLVAVYSLVVATILSLIVINSRMLKNLDNSIDNYSSQVQVLNQEYSVVMDELTDVMSDETVIDKAVEMGMEKA
ncbi:MAG: hypothetical protein IKA61_02700 [Clostridia bacterium]|nr:hypothetical protein [Clostridia bacterium]